MVCVFTWCVCVCSRGVCERVHVMVVVVVVVVWCVCVSTLVCVCVSVMLLCVSLLLLLFLTRLDEHAMCMSTPRDDAMQPSLNCGSVISPARDPRDKRKNHRNCSFS